MRCCTPRILSILPSSFKPGLQNCIYCVILQHLPKRCSPPFVLAGLRLCETGMAESLRVIIVCFRFLFLPVCNAKTVNANHQAELIDSSLLGVPCIL
jgi:hypothetical protein